MRIRNDRRKARDRWAVRLLGGLLAAGWMLSSSGCLMPQTVDLSGLSGVPPAIVKRDLGIEYLMSRRTGMAIRDLRASIRIDPSDPQAHLWLGEAYRRKGKTEEAEVFLLEAIRLSEAEEDSRTTQAARLTLSALLSQMGRYEASIEHCEALVADPTFSKPWQPLTNCGWALLQLGRIDEARAHFKEALGFFPRFGPALLNLGILQTQRGHPLAAIETLERALDSGRLGASGLGEAHYRIGEIYVALGRRDKAVGHFEKATVEAPYANWGTQSQAYLDLLH